MKNRKIMRSIYEILEELKNHPDYVHAELWTKDDILSVLQGDGDLAGISREDITEEEWIGIGENVYHYFENSYENMGAPTINDDDFEVIKMRFSRDNKINEILDSDPLDEILFRK